MVNTVKTLLDDGRDIKLHFVLADQDQLTVRTCEGSVQPSSRPTLIGPIASWLGTTECREGLLETCLRTLLTDDAIGQKNLLKEIL